MQASILAVQGICHCVHLTRLTNLLSEASNGHYNKDTAMLFREAARTSISFQRAENKDAFYQGKLHNVSMVKSNLSCTLFGVNTSKLFITDRNNAWNPSKIRRFKKYYFDNQNSLKLYEAGYIMKDTRIYN